MQGNLKSVEIIYFLNRMLSRRIIIILLIICRCRENRRSRSCAWIVVVDHNLRHNRNFLIDFSIEAGKPSSPSWNCLKLELPSAEIAFKKAISTGWVCVRLGSRMALRLCCVTAATATTATTRVGSVAVLKLSVTLTAPRCAVGISWSGQSMSFWWQICQLLIQSTPLDGHLEESLSCPYTSKLISPIATNFCFQHCAQ